jgi:hypothetical protein
LGSPIFDIMSECRNSGARERERGGDPQTVGRASLSLEKRWCDPRFVRLEFGREKKAMVRNGECGAKQRDEGLTSRGVA